MYCLAKIIRKYDWLQILYMYMLVAGRKTFVLSARGSEGGSQR